VGVSRVPESKEKRRSRARKISAALAKAYPRAWCALHYRQPWELLVATILSAQCTDERVNEVTPELFKKYPAPKALASAPASEVEAVIRPTGFYRQKAKTITGCMRELVERHAGRIPADIDALVKLGGVGRKTANVVLGTAMGVPAIIVDRHVKRVAARLGLTRNNDPDRIEAALRELLPPRQWTRFSHRMIHHGRRICTARCPDCRACPLDDICPKRL